MAFSVEPTKRFQRQARALTKQYPSEFPQLYDLAFEILRTDPLNTKRKYRVLKLRHISPGDGQYRLRLRRYRFRYDVEGSTVVLSFCDLRREDTHKQPSPPPSWQCYVWRCPEAGCP